jgi:G:T-mismatch repair DNA endonuclease (very short patch repair protein)
MVSIDDIIIEHIYTPEIHAAIELVKTLTQNDVRITVCLHTIISKQLLSKLITYYSNNYIALRLQHHIKKRIHAATIIKFRKDYGLPASSFSDSAKLNTVKDRKKHTLLQIYGVDHPSKSEKIKRQKVEKSIAKYGTVNVFQAEEIKKKSKQSMFERYGVYHTIDLPHFTQNNGRRSKLQQKVEKILGDYNIPFETEIGKIFRKFDIERNEFYSPIVDILVENLKLVIEVNGDLWHANPLIYKETDIIQRFRGEMDAKTIWHLDKKRSLQIESFGYTVLVVWESDIKKPTFVKEFIENIKLHENKIHKENTPTN